jgi:hypothetical protein
MKQYVKDMKRKPVHSARICLVMLIVIVSLPVYAQNVAINSTGNPAVASAVLDLSNNKTNGTKGFLGPYVSLTGNTDNTTVASPAMGLIVYNTTIAGNCPNTVFRGYYYWNGAYWIPMSAHLVVLDEAQSVPTGFGASGGGTDLETWGFGHFAASSASVTSLPYSIATNAGEGMYFAMNTDTLYNIQVQGWTLYHAGTGSADVTIYLIKYSLGTVSVAATTSAAGTSLGSASTANVVDANPFTINYTGAKYLPVVAGDVLLLEAVNTSASAETIYMQAQLQFETNGH